MFRLIARGLAGGRFWGRARLQPGRHDPHEPRALAPEGPAQSDGRDEGARNRIAVGARSREQAGVFPTARMRPVEENLRSSGTWTERHREQDECGGVGHAFQWSTANRTKVAGQNPIVGV